MPHPNIYEDPIHIEFIPRTVKKKRNPKIIYLKRWTPQETETLVTGIWMNYKELAKALPSRTQSSIWNRVSLLRKKGQIW
jgi:hypothetical protein